MNFRRLRNATRLALNEQQRQSRQATAWLRRRVSLQTRRIAIGLALAIVVGSSLLLFSHNVGIPNSRRPPQPTPGSLTVEVLRVIDGDTFEVFYDGEPTSVRIVGIDAPERGDVGYGESTDALRRLISNQEVLIDFVGPRKRDNFGRLLARIYVDEQDVGKSLLRNGFARRYEP